MPALSPKTEIEQLHWLSFFALNGELAREEAGQALTAIPADDLGSMLRLADLHHIAIRLFGPLAENSEMLQQEVLPRASVNNRTITIAAAICKALEKHGCPAMAIKSTDHWPDLGDDFDLFTTGDVDIVHRFMKMEFGTEPLPQSWGDRLANKWNFCISGLKPLIEIHVGRLGQTGELKTYGAELIARRRQRAFGDDVLFVPAHADQIILSTLQRLYRHFFYRICDFVDTLNALDGAFDFEELRRIAKRHGIWQGVATHLRLVSEYAAHYKGVPVTFPAFVRKSGLFGIERIHPHASYLRLPIFPQGATLWGNQVVKAWKRSNHSGALRLGLVPPLAAVASATYKATGRQDIW